MVLTLRAAYSFSSEHRSATAVPPRVRERYLDPVLKQHAVRQPGEAVVERLVLDLLHVRVDLPRRAPQDREQRDEQCEQQDLEDERDRDEGPGHLAQFQTRTSRYSVSRCTGTLPSDLIVRTKSSIEAR